MDATLRRAATIGIAAIILGGTSAAIAATACPTATPFIDGINAPAKQYASGNVYSLNTDGILVYDYGKRYNNLGKWENPFFISRYANALYNDWFKTGCADDALKSAFLLQAEWFMAHAEKRGDDMEVWSYPFDNSHYGVAAGWISAIGQSHIASVLYRAFAITGDERYRQMGEKAIAVYLHSPENGGVTAESADGLWVQEIPNPKPNSVQFDVLNGHITGLYGVMDWISLTGDKRYQHVVDGGIDAVRNNISKFDAGFTSFYSLHVASGAPAKIAQRGKYNNLHVRQLARLYEIDGDPVFEKYSNLFRKYDKARYKRSSKSFSKEGYEADQASGIIGTKGWTDTHFPTWYQIDLPEGSILDGAFLESLNQRSSLKDFTVELLTDGKWTRVFADADNESARVYLAFNQPTKADAIRISIKSTNNPVVVSLKTAMPILSSATEGVDPAAGSAHTAPFGPGFRERPVANN